MLSLRDSSSTCVYEDEFVRLQNDGKEKKNVRCRDYTKFEVITPNYALGDGNIGVSVVRNGNLGFVENIANKLV